MRARCLVLVVIALGCGRGPERTTPRAEREVTRVASNILRADYAGSAACADCHDAIHAAWQSSPMRRMTRVASRGGSEGGIEAPFDGAVLRVGADTATMETIDGARYVRIASAAEGARRFRVTKVIGGRYREDYVGVDVTSARDPAKDWGPERVLPMSYVFSTRAWRYKGYSVMVKERPGLRVRAVWTRTCIPCHNTLPYLTLLYDDLLGAGAPSYQGTMTDDVLPPSRRWRAEVRDADALAREISGELGHIGAPRPDPGAPLADVLADAIAGTRRYFGGTDLVEVGVGCESCHGGAAAHARAPEVRPSFSVASPLVDLRITGGAPSRAQAINRTCARCHTVLFTGYPWTWEGGRRDDPVPGGSTTNSGEARDFLLGGCATQLACTACHDPHAADRPDALARTGGTDGNAICARCHAALATPDGLAAHSHHPPGPGSACVGCHMPRKNMGLSYELVRYHRIGSPTDAARVTGDRPLECALCHADRTVGELVATMERWWGKSYDRARLRALYGDLDARVLASTLARGKPHEQAVAIGVLGERGAIADVPRLAPHLAHPYPLVRYYAKHAIERLTGAPLPIDVGQPAAEIAPEVARWLAGRGGR